MYVKRTFNKSSIGSFISSCIVQVDGGDNGKAGVSDGKAWKGN